MNDWKRVELASLMVTPGWKKVDAARLQKLQKSLQLFGQLRPLIVHGHEILDGRQLHRAMLNIGWTTAMAVVFEEAPAPGYIELATDLVFEPDYVQLASAVMGFDVASTELATISRFSAQRIDYFKELLYFDWSQFQIEQEQEGLFEEESSSHATRRGESPEDAVGILPAAQRVDKKMERLARIKPAPAVSRITPPPPPPLPPRPPAPQRPPVSPNVTGAREATYVAPPITGDTVGNMVPGGTTLVRFIGEPSPAERAYIPDEPPQLDGVDEIELDTETTGLKWWEGDRPIGISVRRPDGKTWYLPFGHAGGNLDEAVVKRWAQTELKGKTITGANIKFDNHMLYGWGVDLEEQSNRLSDVQHHAALLDDYRRRFALDELSKDFLGKEKSGQDLDKTIMADYHASAVAEYAKRDVELTGELRAKMIPMLREQELMKVLGIEEDVIYPVCEMERNAAPMDRELLRRWCHESEQEYHQLLEVISDEAGFMCNPDRNDDMIRLFEKLNIPITQFTEGGAPSFTDKLLKSIDHPLVAKARRAGKLASLRSKFLVSYNAVVGDDCLLRFELNQLRGDQYGTNRGRFSSSNKNIQQVMGVDKQRLAWGYDEDDDSHDDEIYLIRKLFTAGSPEYEYLSSDAMQIEYRLFAHIAKDPTILARYAEDPFVSYHKIVWDMVEPYVGDIKYPKVKILNFMLIYGGGQDKTAETLELPREISDQFSALYHRTFPGIKPLLDATTELAKKRGYIKTIAGRRQRFPDPNFAYKGFNAWDQGSAADIMKVKIVEVHKARKITGFKMRMTVHDELTGDTPDKKCTEMVNEILNRQSFPLRVPILWKTTTGKNWAVC